MEFTTRYSVDECRRYLSGHVSSVPVIADTEVEIHSVGAASYEYSVRRVWKGLQGMWRYTVMEATGILRPTQDNKTQVTSKIQLHGMGYVTIAFMILLFGYGLA